MHHSQYRKIAGHPLRHLFRSMVTDPRDLPTRTELRAAIEEAVPEGTDQETKDGLFEAATDFAQAAAEDRGSWFELRGAADRYVLGVVEQWEDADRIIPSEAEDIDVGAAVNSVLRGAPRTVGGGQNGGGAPFEGLPPAEIVRA